MATFSFDKGVLVIKGSGYETINSRDLPLSIEREKVRKIEIKEGISTISPYCFYSFINLAIVSLSDDITEIGEGAFKYCINLTSITLPINIKEIKKETFIGCSSLTKVILNESIQSIKENASVDAGLPS